MWWQSSRSLLSIHSSITRYEYYGYRSAGTDLQAQNLKLRIVARLSLAGLCLNLESSIRTLYQKGGRVKHSGREAKLAASSGLLPPETE